LTQGERKWRWNSSFFQHFVASLFEQAPQGFEREQAPMPEAENAFAAIIELTKREHDPSNEKRHVRSRDNDFGTSPHGLASQLVHEILRIVHVLNQIHQQDLIIARNVGGRGRLRRKRGNRSRFRQFTRGEIYRGDMTKFSFQFGRHVSMADSELQDISARNARFNGEGLRRRKPELVAVSNRSRLNIEPAIVKKLNAAEARLDGRSKDIPGVAQTIDVANLVSVKSWNRQFSNPELFEHKLNDDLGIEMEIARVLFERDLRQRRRRI
jgi:hypothetical protein